MKFLVLAIAFFTLTACSNKNPNDVVAVKAGDEYYQVDQSASRSLEGKTDDRVICKRRVVTGSNRKEKVCTTQAQIDRDRADADRIMRESEKVKTRTLIQSRKGN